MYRLTKSNGRLLVRHSQSALQLVAVVSALLIVFQIVRSFTEPATLNSLWALALFFIISLIMMSHATYEFDMTSRILQYRIRGPLFRKREGQIPFDAINTVELEYHQDSDGDGYRIVLHGTDLIFPLNDTYDNKEAQLECFKQVHEAILQRLPDLQAVSTVQKIDSKSKLKEIKRHSNNLALLENYSNEEVMALVRQRKLIEAIKLVRNETGCDLKAAKDYVDRLKQK